MKFIFSFLIMCILSTQCFAVFVEEQICTGISSVESCTATAGCDWDSQFGGECGRCEQDKYNNGSGCTACPSNRETTQSGATSVYDCTCEANHYMICNGSDYCSCQQRPEHSTYNENTHQFECRGYSTLNNNTCECPPYSQWDGGENRCKCDPNYGEAITGNTLTCTHCGEYAFVLDNECVCKGNTYGDPYVGCTKCPAGMLTVVSTPETDAIHNPNFQGEPGATSKSQCKIGAFTKFCNGNGTNCMRLMQ